MQRKDNTSAAFLVLPAIDVLEGRVVRLAGGERGRITVDGGDPAAAAGRFAAEGAPWLHLVDLDGAFSGRATPGLLERVVAAAGAVPVQVGGGYRDTAAIEQALAAGAERVLVGTAALSPGFLDELAPLGERVAVAVDVREGRVAVNGWTDTEDV